MIEKEKVLGPQFSPNFTISQFHSPPRYSCHACKAMKAGNAASNPMAAMGAMVRTTSPFSSFFPPQKNSAKILQNSPPFRGITVPPPLFLFSIYYSNTI